MTMKKLLICMVLFVALLLTVVSCGDQKKEEPAGTDAKGNPVTAEQVPGENPGQGTQSGENGTTPGESTTTNSQGGGQLENAGADTAGGWGELHTVS